MTVTAKDVEHQYDERGRTTRAGPNNISVGVEEVVTPLPSQVQQSSPSHSPLECPTHAYFPQHSVAVT